MHLHLLTVPQAQAASFVILIVLALSVLITDIWKGNIYNLQTYTGCVLGGCLFFLSSGFSGLGTSLLGALAGLCILLPFYLLGGMGAGDVKYLAAIGALKGWYFVVITMYYSALIGGFMAIAIIIWKGRFWKTIKSTFSILRHPKRKRADDDDPLFLPYGVAISIGSLLTLFVT